VHSGEDLSTLIAVLKLGILYSDQGKLHDAKAMIQRALDGFDRILGPDHPTTLDVILRLGTLQGQQGRTVEAE